MAARRMAEGRFPRRSPLVVGSEGERIGGQEPTLEADHRYVDAVESDVAAGVTNLLGG